MSDMRELFETWAMDSTLQVDLSKGNHDSYTSTATHWLYCAWVCAWNSSREAMVVAAPAWPDHYDYTNSDVAGAAIVDCRVAFQKSMRAQGLKVKP